MLVEELKQKLAKLVEKSNQPTVQQEIAQLEADIKAEERQAVKEQVEKAQAERAKLRAENVFETTLTAKCNRCNKNVEMAQVERTLRNHSEQLVLSGQCFNPKCASKTEYGNADLAKPLLFVILPLTHGGRYRGAME